MAHRCNGTTVNVASRDITSGPRNFSCRRMRPSQPFCMAYRGVATQEYQCCETRFVAILVFSGFYSFLLLIGLFYSSLSMHGDGDSFPIDPEARSEVAITELGNEYEKLQAAPSIVEEGRSADTRETEDTEAVRKDQCPTDPDNRPLSATFCQVYSYLCALTAEHLRNLSLRHRLAQGFAETCRMRRYLCLFTIA